MSTQYSKRISLEPASSSIRVALAEVELGNVLLRVSLRRFRDGRLRVFWPTWDDGESCLDGVKPILS